MLLASDTLIHFICKSRCLRRKVSGPRVGSIPASNSKRSETEIIYLSTVKIRWTAKLRLQKSSVQYWKWWLCESSRSHLQLLLGLRNISYGCHSRFLSASDAREPPISHISPSPSARGDVCRSAIRWKWAPGKIYPGMLCESCPTPPDRWWVVRQDDELALNKASWGCMMHNARSVKNQNKILSRSIK